MNVLDENILESQRQLLRSWRIPVRQIGHELGRKGMQDEEIIPYLLTLRRPMLFTRDLGFYARSLCHPRYAHAKRMGAVIRVTHSGLAAWRVHAEHEVRHAWPDER